MNIDTIHYLNLILGAGAIFLQIISFVTLLVLFFGPKKSTFLDFIEKNFLSVFSKLIQTVFVFIEKNFLTIGFLISFFAALFSLVYSEIIKFAPCELCWFQRVFLFPQVFIFGIALWNNFRHQISEAKNVIKYSMPLILVGFIISVYQNFNYYFGEGGLTPCGASGVSCYQHLVSEFGGYISIPMLSLTVFFALLTITLVVHFYKKD